MPIFEIETNQGIFEIDADREPTQSEALQAISAQFQPEQLSHRETVQDFVNKLANIVSKREAPLETGVFPEEKLTSEQKLIGGALALGRATGVPGILASEIAKRISPAIGRAERLQAGAAAEGALRTITAGLSDAAAKELGAPITGREAARMIAPEAAAIGEISGVALPAGRITQAGTTLPRVALEGARMGGIFGAGGELASAIEEGEPTIGEVLPRMIKGGLLGSILGGTIPAGVAIAARPKELTKLVTNYGKRYRQILAPGKGEISKVEIKSGKDIDKSFELAAEEGLILDKTSDNKIDTSLAREQLQPKKEAIDQELTTVIASKPEKSFNLNQFRESAKARMRDLFKNDAEYESALRQIDEEIDATIRNRGENVSASDLNEVKRGMWSKGYSPLAPNSNKISRQIGNVMKDAIEKAYPDADIKGLNKRLGDYITLETLLENAHGRVVARGKIGKYAAQVTGAIAGSALPIPVLGELTGALVGGKISDILVDPRSITSRMARSIERIKGSASEALPPVIPPPVMPTILPESPIGITPQESLAQQIAESIQGTGIPSVPRGTIPLEQMIGQAVPERAVTGFTPTPGTTIPAETIAQQQRVIQQLSEALQRVQTQQVQRQALAEQIAQQLSQGQRVPRIFLPESP